MLAFLGFGVLALNCLEVERKFQIGFCEFWLTSF